MKFAVFKTGGKQYKVSVGDILEVERLSAPDKKIKFEEVLLYSDGDALEIGKPNASGIAVEATILEDIRGEKIRVAKYKSKVRYRRVNGHRQALTRVKIDTIGKATKARAKTSSGAKPKVAAKSK